MTRLRRGTVPALTGGALLAPLALLPAATPATAPTAVVPAARAAQLSTTAGDDSPAPSAGGYRFRGTEITGGTGETAPAKIVPGQYLDTIGPGETRFYTADLDAASAADLAVTAVPQPGAPVDPRDGLRLQLHRTGRQPRDCDRAEARFGQDEGAMPLTAAVSRVPSPDSGDGCDGPGRYRLSVTRDSSEGSDRARWPIELHVRIEEPLPGGAAPAQSETEYGSGGADARLPTAVPRDTEGGTGFNDATELAPGVWRDRLLPARTRWYKVSVGWGQQLRYRVELANAPTLPDGSSTSATESTSATSHLAARTYAPGRRPVPAGSEFDEDRRYTGQPTAVDNGTVPVSWTNRWEHRAHVRPVCTHGYYHIAVSLGPDAALLTGDTEVGVVLRISVIGTEKTGPQHGAGAVPSAEGRAEGGNRRAAADGRTRGDGAPDDRAADRAAGRPATGIAVTAAGGVVLLAAAVLGYLRLRRGSAAKPGSGTSGMKGTSSTGRGGR